MTGNSAPVRLRMIEAMTRRAQAHEGEARRILDARLATLKAAHEEAVEATRAAQAGATTAAPAPTRTDGPLAQLAHYIAQNTATAATPLDAVGEPEALRYLRSTWSRLSADKRLTQSLAKVPDKAGPLNSHQLVHRALSAMRDASPDYFHHFVSYVDALMALDPLNGAGAASAAAEKASPAPSTRQRKSTRGK